MRQVRPQCGFNHAEDFRPMASASSSMLMEDSRRLRLAWSDKGRPGGR
jgi:hypothetical protein